jgi:hypothetical protein
MSTAQHARDLELVRRAVGDRGLTFFGRGYGAYLGQVYANLFPERVRTMVLDGPVDPIALVGTRATAERPMYDRLGSPAASWSALREMLLRCDKAGRRCAFAAGDPLKRLAEIARRLKARPLVLPDPVTERPQPFGYADLVERLAAALRDAEGWIQVSDMLAELWTLTQPSAAVAPAPRAAAAARLAVERTTVRAGAAERAQAARRFGPDPGTQTFEYDNRLEVFSGVTCSDGWHGANPDSWRSRAAEADRRVPYFGRLWAWSTVQCARSAWTARDEDAHRGPFTRRTASPVLVVGGRWNPVTGYPAARTVARLLPGSRLLLSDSWGDQAYFTSTCATTAIERYLVGGRLPKAGTVCRAKDQPYTTSEGRSLRSAASTTPSAARTPRGGVQ